MKNYTLYIDALKMSVFENHHLHSLIDLVKCLCCRYSYYLDEKYHQPMAATPAIAAPVTISEPRLPMGGCM